MLISIFKTIFLLFINYFIQIISIYDFINQHTTKKVTNKLKHLKIMINGSYNLIVISKSDLFSYFWAVCLQFGNNAFNFCFTEFFKVCFSLNSVWICSDGKGKTVFTFTNNDSGWGLSDWLVVVGDIVSYYRKGST